VRDRDRPARRMAGVRWLLAVAVGLAAAAAACGADEKPAARPEMVLYGIGVSTDPYGRSRPRGVGVAFGVGSPRQRTATIRDRELRPVRWLDRGRAVIVDFDQHVPRYEILHVDRMRRTRAPIPSDAANAIWWRDRIAYQRRIACRAPNPRATCYRLGRRTFVNDGSTARGQALTWTPRGRLVVSRRGALHVLGRRAPLLSLGRRASLGAPIWTPDGRYFALIAHVRGRVGTVVVATGAGRIVRTFHSPYVISMLTWAPRGRRLAWTTSGFPDPHELFVADIDGPAPPRRLFATERHFDWVTWSPDGRRLLLDDEHAGAWRLIEPGRPGRRLQRPGGMPQWCCPYGAFVTAG
jgi:hypothetical protein